MSVLVQQQDESINAIDTTAAQVEHNTEAGLVLTRMFIRLMSDNQYPCRFIPQSAADRKGSSACPQGATHALDLFHHYPHHPRRSRHRRWCCGQQQC